jgi:hypothetical protein
MFLNYVSLVRKLKGCNETQWACVKYLNNYNMIISAVHV